MPGPTVPAPSEQPTSQPSSNPTHHDPKALLPAPAVAPPAKKSGWVRLVLITLVLLAVVGGVIWKIHANQAETAATPAATRGAGGGPIPVLVQPVAQRTVPIYLTALGTVTPYYSVTIKSRVDGQLLSVPVMEGQKVSKGQLLAQIDPRPYQAAVAQAEGALTKDEANAANMRAEASRYTALYSAGVISKESQQAQVSNAGQANGAIQGDQAAIQAAKVNLAYTHITSPISGVVGLRTVDPGNIVHASDSTGMMLVNQVQPIAVIFTLPEDQLPQVIKLIHGGAKLQVEAYDRSETTHLATGTLLTIDNTIDTTTGTAKVKAVFPNLDNALFPNQFVNIRLILEERANSLIVPSAAVQTATTGNFLYVVREGNPPVDPNADGAAGGKGGKGKGGKGAPAADATAAAAPADATTKTGGGSGRPAGPPHYVQQVPIKVDVTQGSNVIVEGDIKQGDLVVIDGQEKLKPNSRVTPSQNAGRSSGGAPGAGNGGSRNGNASGPAGTPPSGQNGNGSAASGTPGAPGSTGSGGTGTGQQP